MRLRLLMLPLAAIAFPLLSVPATAQSRIKDYPGYERYEASAAETRKARTISQFYVWSEDGKQMYFQRAGKWMLMDLATGKAEASGAPPSSAPPRRRGGSAEVPDRGRQITKYSSPDGKWEARYVDRNVRLVGLQKQPEVAVTTDGSVASGIKYGTASWVYGEELGQRQAMGWSPDSKRLWYYRFDESKCLPYFIATQQLQVQNTVDTEFYPKPGTPNPEVDLVVYDVSSGRSKNVRVRDKVAFGPEVGHYVYGIRWSPDGSELLFHRTDRLQQTMEFCAANPVTGVVRVIFSEKNPLGWVDNLPEMKFFDDLDGIEKRPELRGKILLSSERSGYRNLFIVDIKTGAVRSLTQHPFEVGGVLRIDLSGKQIFYEARSAPMPYRMQLHRVGLDGSGDKRLTDPAFHHELDVSPTGKFFADSYQRIDAAPVSQLCAGNGTVIGELDRSDLEPLNQAGYSRAERLELLAADGKTKLFGYLQKPANFDPKRRYPLLVDVYGGPESGDSEDRYRGPSRIAEFGFLVASFDSRGTTGQGRAFRQSGYLKLGQVEIDDQAAGVKFLVQRPYVDPEKVGIFGTSYGGFASAMAILRYPDVFQAACANSSVTDWKLYDSIYTERYMQTPELNPDGYKLGSTLTYAKNLTGALMLFYGTSDNNVHPANTYWLANALRKEGKSFEMLAGPDMGHSAPAMTRIMEYFIERLILLPQVAK